MQKTILIESPFHLLCALGLINDQTTLVVRETTKNTGIQLRECLRSLPIHAKEIKHIPFMGSLFDPLSKLIGIWLMARSKNKILYFGYYRSTVARFFLSQKKSDRSLHLLDDGIHLLHPNKVNELAKEGTKLYSIFFDLMEPNDYQAELIPNRVDLNDFEQKSYKAKPIQVFIGSKMYSHGFIDFEQYLRIVQNAFELGYRHYIPHRDEDQSRLAEIANIGFTIININYPIELIQFYGDYQIEKAIGISTAALLTLQLFFKLPCTYVKATNLLTGNKEFIQHIYSYFDKVSMPFIEIHSEN